METSKIIFKTPEIKKLNNNRLYKFLKRLIDILVSIFSLILLFLPMILISLIIKLDRGPVLFKQTRLGLNGKHFILLKFRTMKIDAEKDGFKWTEKNDPRITKFGKLIRKYRLDELPQLINIIIGDMTIVGPRPEVPYFYNQFGNYIHGFDKRLMVKPGLTGWAQVNGGYDLNAKEKIIFDIEYINNQSFFLDIKIMIMTVFVVVFKKGAQ
jgi:lipopolysaccharide/colanic/teichoic acid biosynthesis glycosyltransferase